MSDDKDFDELAAMSKEEYDREMARRWTLHRQRQDNPSTPEGTYSYTCDACGESFAIDNYGNGQCPHCDARYEYDEGHRLVTHKTCKTCKWWGDAVWTHKPFDPSQQRSWDNEQHRECKHSSMETFADDAMNTSSREYYPFTGPDFGCIHWEARY